MKTIIKFAVIQSGQCVFGAGGTKQSALIDACKWLEPRDGVKYTPKMLAEQCSRFQFVGDLQIIDRESDPETFDSYLRNQGGFVQSSRGNWRSE